ncbi:MAG: glycoside hydrolase family 3 C-terminal domain-containing protein, partial [Rhodothermia bacterium]|nr:glycoside hydrolase family 3 C-terminal domain-containing protein [Rhodothermia bacterium]
MTLINGLKDLHLTTLPGKSPAIGCSAFCLLLLCAAFGPVNTTLSQPAVNAVEEAFVDSVLALMTLEEKLGQLNQYRGEWGDTGPIAPAGGEDQVRAGMAGSFLSIYGAEYNGRLQRIAVEESRLGVPLLFAQDVIHGFRTIFPMPLALAGSWDVDLMEKASRIAAEEASSAGVHWTFAPMVDMSREPRWGRIVEGFGEDPLLASELSAASVRGFQGDDLSANNTILATAKHFVAYGGAEGGRDYNTVDASERTLWEFYLPPFRAAVQENVQSVMPAFNEVAGIPMHAHDHLINDVLRDRWGFDGVVVSDYTGVMELMPHGVAADRREAGILGLGAGVDIDMVSGIYLEELPDAVRSGDLSEAIVDEAARRVLRAKYRLGLFDDPYLYNDPDREARTLLTEEHLQVARDAARQSIILLKNDDSTLPLSKSLGTLAVVGPLADNARVTLGGWAAAGRANESISILEGIRRAVSPQTVVVHGKGSE